VPAREDAATPDAAMDAASPVDVPTVDAVDSGAPDVPPPPAQALLGLVRSHQGTHYRVGSGVVTPGASAPWRECGAGFSFIGLDFQAEGFWLCATTALAERRFYVGNVFAGANTFWSVQRGNLTHRGPGTRDACPPSSTLLGRYGSVMDGFWVCMDEAMPGRYARAWEFNTNGSLDGWTPNGTLLFLSVNSGRVEYSEFGHDPYLVSPDNLDLDASNSLIYVGLHNSPASREARLFFQTNDVGGFTMDRSVGVNSFPNDPSVREYVFDMSAHPEWRGTVRRIRFDPGDAPGTYGIDYIRVQAPSARELSPRWTFDTDVDGWRTLRGTILANEGILSQQVFTDDAAMESPDLTLPAARHLLRLRVRNGLPETQGEVYFSTSAAAGFAQSRSVRFEMVARDPVFREYVADMSVNPAWRGTVTKIRVDFGASSRGLVDVDWIGFDE
ncbi:MAG: hypothetical protein R3A48_23230, partial [Polyangiales bacterium]